MFVINYVKNRLTSPTEPIHIIVDEMVNEDDWVEVQRQEGQENFVPVEMPEIMSVEDALMVDDCVVQKPPRKAPLIPPTNDDEIRRRNELNAARAKTAARKRLEKEFFSDPESGKDVRYHKIVLKRSSKNSYPTVAPRDYTQNKVQRSKISSGKSNDRKVHLEFDIFTFPDS